MAVIRPRAAPAVEAVRWDGSNTEEVLELVRRVASLNCWGPLATDAQGDLWIDIRTNPEEPHLGLNICRRWWTNVEGEAVENEMIVLRIEEGNTLVFELFRETPLFVLSPDEINAFYLAGD